MKFFICTLAAACVLLGGSMLNAKTVFNDFEKRKAFKSPHRFNTAKTALSIKDGTASFTVAPGMFGASNDRQNGRERAEIAIDVRKARWVRQSFKVRAAPGFKAPRRTMIAQIKVDGRNTKSPPVAVYMTGTGEVKCERYDGRRVIVKTASKGINLSDGKWHQVVMEFVRSDDNGYCRITIDGRVILEMKGHDNDANGPNHLARIGPYRDAMPFPQTIEYDDWRVEYKRKVPNYLASVLAD